MAAEPTSPATLALWISGIGILSTLLSSLIVVLVNSRTTLKAKEIDAQLKKDEQAYGYKMEYYKRKLSAGEKEITSLYLNLSMFSTLREYYSSILEVGKFSNELEEFKTKLYERITEKNNEYILEVNHGFNAYFKPLPNDAIMNELSVKNTTINDKLNMLNADIQALKASAISEQDLAQRNNMIIKTNSAIDSLKTLLKEYISNSLQLEAMTRDSIALIREEMLASIAS